MAPYVTDVAVRWSDQDAYGHVNHAAVVTLIEEARIRWLFDDASREGVAAFQPGLLVSQVEVRYRRQIPWTVAGIRVTMWAHEVRAASFRVAYRLHLEQEDRPAVEADTQLVPYDLDALRPRRLVPDEREFLVRFAEDG